MKSLSALYSAACCLLLLACSSHSEKKAPGADEAAMTVNVAAPIVKDIELTASYPGYLTADDAVPVIAQVNGRILKKNYESGQMVKKGDVLFIIDSATYRDRVQQAQATLDQALSQRDYAQNHYEAVKKALEADAVSKMEVQQAENALAQAEASIQSARAALETANRNLSYCTVRAPMAGQVSKNVIGENVYVTGEGSPVTLATVYKNDYMNANFSIEDARYLEMLNNASVKATASNINYSLASQRNATGDTIDLSSVAVTFSEALPHPYTGVVSYLAPSLNRSTGTIDMQVKIENPYNELRAGMYVEIHLPYAKVNDAVLVRDASIGSNQLGKYLYVVNDSNRVVYTPITVGDLYQDTLRLVTKGLKPGQRYVTEALLKVRDGETVSPREVK